MINYEKKRWVDNIMGKMDLSQKVGQLMVFGMCGPVITPDTVELITKHYVGGIQVSQLFRVLTAFNNIKPGEQPDPSSMRSILPPSGLNRDYVHHHPIVTTPSQFAAVCNRLRQYALDRPLSIPLHIPMDQEGSGSDDFLGGIRLFPHAMGVTASGDLDLAYRIADCLAKQVRAIGANLIHSPVLDVNTNPRNPEIGTRSYGDNADDVIQFASQTIKGFMDNQLFATGKHFPGRGESAADAHWGLPGVDLDRDTLMKTHIRPYQALIEQGLPAIMVAHCKYPCLGATEKPASMSREIVTDFLRGELGYQGVVITDNMMMGGILRQYEMSQACVEALKAGCDIILCRDESPIRLRIVEQVLQAVKSGDLTEAQVDEKVCRILGMRWDMGLVENGGFVDPAKADAIIHDPIVVNTAKQAAEKTIMMMRDKAGTLPLRPDQRVLLIEQVFPTQAACNNLYSHPGLLWEEMCMHSLQVGSLEIKMRPDDADEERVMRRVEEEWDVIVITNYYFHIAAASISKLVRKVQKAGKPVVVVTNTFYETGAPSDFPTVVVCFNPGAREHMTAVGELLFGKASPTATLPVRLC